MSDTVIKVENLGKCYQLRASSSKAGYRTLRDEVAGLPAKLWSFLAKPAAVDEFWALRDVSFEVRRGEVLGVIGRNGAGKSTLLKIISRIVEPTAGAVDIYGRVGSLLEVGTGFHPELTGRENIFLSGAMLGMRRHEVRARFDEIVSFAGVERFVDTACKHYSSGMYLRLGFAVAAHLDTDILIVDEVLAVGDAEFQKKCLGKMADVSRTGRTVLFVSHNMAAVTALCSRALWLDAGRVKQEGEVQAVAAGYFSHACDAAPVDLGARTARTGDGRMRFEQVNFAGGDGGGRAVCGMDLRVEVAFGCPSGPVRGRARFAILIRSGTGDPLFTLDSIYTNAELAEWCGAGRVACEVPQLPLAAGRYRVNLWCTIDGTVADFVEDACELEVCEGDYYGTGRSPIPHKNGMFLVPQTWKTPEADQV